MWFRIKAIAVQAPASAQAAEEEEEYNEEEEEYEDDDNEYEDEDEEEEEVGGRAAPPIAAASLIVPVVGNHHNQQRNHVNANFEGSSSHLAILYEPLLGKFVQKIRSDNKSQRTDWVPVTEWVTSRMTHRTKPVTYVNSYKNDGMNSKKYVWKNGGKPP